VIENLLFFAKYFGTKEALADTRPDCVCVDIRGVFTHMLGLDLAANLLEGLISS
jgi:hypothetical protein